ncbi:hypothetical protein J2M53_06190 [Arthrobacter sp. zg-ZUI100]|uniref:hypothetical protein n=1 Tax=Arthrobacter jiangjiafuii TaxID=2817475 RepID=UPI001AEEA825|nr:hypothetical protein [Arthrobacter jiangjiafuii]MBP3035845.1 hypothetical protein [Arthrobacter jiangjiafuii]
MDNKLPESENEADDLAVRRLLSQSEVEESPELLEGLRRLRSFRAAPAPEPSGRLAALLQGSVTPAPKSSRGRGIVLSFAVAGAMAAGVSGVAASDEVLRTCESIIDAFDQDQEAPVPESPAGEEPLAGSPGQQQDVLPGAAAEPAGAAVSADPSSAELPGPVLPEVGVPATAVIPADPARIAVSPPATAKTPAAAPTGPAASPGAVDAGTQPGPVIVPVPAPVVTPARPEEPPALAQPEPQPEGQVWVLPGRDRGEEPVPHPWPSPPTDLKTQNHDDRRGSSGSVDGEGHAETGWGTN